MDVDILLNFGSLSSRLARKGVFARHRFAKLKSAVSASGESDHSGAGGLPLVFNGFCEQGHVQDLLFVRQGKAGRLIK
jgi:hypothetical protein